MYTSTSTEKGSTGKTASKNQPCPLCGHEDWCWFLEDQEIYKVVCGRTSLNQTPPGWQHTGCATDGRNIFIREEYKRSRKSSRNSKYPEITELVREQREDIPQWFEVEKADLCKGDRVRITNGIPTPEGGWILKDWKLHKSSGSLHAVLEVPGSNSTAEVPQKDIEYYSRDCKGYEAYTEFIYSETQKVVRTQWSDRRSVYNGQTKKVRPWHKNEYDCWVEGKGSSEWPLYREEEAIATIKSGGIVFAGGGEQVVETLRLNGFTATTCASGESNFPKIPTRLVSAFAEASEYELKPLLIIWPDNDETGNRAKEAALKECWKNKIPAVALEPRKLWPAEKKGDALDFFEWAHQQGMDIEAIRRQLENAIDDAIDDAIEESRLRWQREQWKAPVSHQGEIGFWREDKEGNRWFEPACNFDFVVERELQASKGTVLVVKLKRSFESGEKRIELPWSETFRPYDFLKALNRLGSGVVCKLSAPDLASLLHSRLHEYRTNRNGRVFRQIDRYGQQADGVWVFRDRQYTPQGELTSEEETGWVFSNISAEGDDIPFPVLAPENSAALTRLVEASRQFFGEDNIHQVLLTMGWVTAGLHSQAIFRREHAFPLLNGHGEPGSCKTLAAETALSLVGTNWPQMGMLARVSVSAIYEYGSRTGSLPFIWDDPERDRSNEELLKSWFNWKARVVRGNKQEPHSPLGVTSNHVFGGDQAAAYTRFVRIPFERASGGDNGTFQELQAAQREASGAFPELLKLGYPVAAIAQLERELLNHLPKAHARIAKSLAIVTYYAQRIVQMTASTEDVKRWVLDNLCPAEDDADSAGDSLTDFIDKIHALEAGSLVGAWNKQSVATRDGRSWVALHHNQIWPLVDREYHPATYNLKALKPLVVKAGGIVDSTQRFVKSRDAQLAYERSLITPNDENPPIPPETVPRKAWLLPAALFESWDDSGGGGGNNPSEPFNPSCDDGGGGGICDGDFPGKGGGGDSCNSRDGEPFNPICDDGGGGGVCDSDFPGEKVSVAVTSLARGRGKEIPDCTNLEDSLSENFTAAETVATVSVWRGLTLRIKENLSALKTKELLLAGLSYLLNESFECESEPFVENEEWRVRVRSSRGSVSISCNWVSIAPEQPAIEVAEEGESAADATDSQQKSADAEIDAVATDDVATDDIATDDVADTEVDAVADTEADENPQPENLPSLTEVICLAFTWAAQQSEEEGRAEVARLRELYSPEELREGARLLEQRDRSGFLTIAQWVIEAANSKSAPSDMSYVANFLKALAHLENTEALKQLKELMMLETSAALHYGAAELFAAGCFETLILKLQSWLKILQDDEYSVIQKQAVVIADALGLSANRFPAVGDRVWRKPVPAKKGKPFEPGIELVVTSLTPNGAFADSASGDRYHISWHAWESGTFTYRE